MKLRFLTLVMIFIASSSIALGACGKFKFTNNFQENLYIVIAPEILADFCPKQGPPPSVIYPGQTVNIYITAGKEDFIDVTTQQDQFPIHANYFLQLSFKDRQYNFRDELNTQSYSWSDDKSKLAFCTNQTFKDSAGNCFLLK